MNTALHQAALMVFLASAPLLLAIRFIRPSRMPWVLAVPLAMGLAWAAANVAVHYRFEALGDQIRQHGDAPPNELMDQWASDGGPRIGAAFLGWLYGLVYLVPWVGIYGLARWIQRRFAAPT